MVAAEEGVGPAGGAAEGLVLDDRGVLEHVLLVAFVLGAVVGAAPDAFEVGDFAQAVAGSAAGAVALVLGALGFGAEVFDVGERAVAAVFAAEHGGFAGVLEDAERSRALVGVARA